MGFASNDHFDPATESDQQFKTVSEAFAWASEQYSEYGVSLDHGLQFEDVDNGKRQYVLVFEISEEDLEELRTGDDSIEAVAEKLNDVLSNYFLDHLEADKVLGSFRPLSEILAC